MSQSITTEVLEKGSRSYNHLTKLPRYACEAWTYGAGN
jgi:hypothetical protein